MSRVDEDAATIDYNLQYAVGLAGPAKRDSKKKPDTGRDDKIEVQPGYGRLGNGRRKYDPTENDVDAEPPRSTGFQDGMVENKISETKQETK